MALVDSDYKFIWADIGCMGSSSDAQIYNASELTECVEAWSRMGSSLLLPLPSRPLRPRLSATGVFFVGFTDIAFPLLVGMLNNSGVYRGARSSARNDSSLVITENLTKRRSELLQKARSVDGVVATWTIDGRIVCLVGNGRKVSIVNERDLASVRDLCRK